MDIRKLFVAAALLALPAFAAEGIPGATVAGEGVKPPYGRHGAMHESCKAEPEKCKAEAQARHDACKADPEKCRKERMAQREKLCAQNPEKCKEMRARMEQRQEQCKADPEKCRQEHQARAEMHFKKTDTDGNGMLSRAEAEKGMPRLARHFDAIDINKDGQLSKDEMTAARKARHDAKSSRKV